MAAWVPAAIQAAATIGSSLLGNNDQNKKLDNWNKEQKDFFSKYVNNANLAGGQGAQDALGLLKQYLNPQSDVYKNFEQPYLNEFNNRTIPMLAERFAGLGGGMGGGLSSSGFGQALGTAGADLQSNLASLKSQLQRGSINDLLNFYMQMASGVIGAQPFSYANRPGESNPLSSFMQGFNSQGFGGGFGNLFGNSSTPSSSVGTGAVSSPNIASSFARQSPGIFQT